MLIPLRDRRLWLGAACFVVGLGLLSLLFLPKASPGKQAERALLGALDQNAAAIVESFCPMDFEDGGLTREVAMRLAEEVILPKISGTKSEGKLKVLQDPKGTWGAATVFLQTPNGVQPFSVGMIRTERGLCLPADMWLRACWVHEAGGVSKFSTFAAGLRRDRAKLDAIGVKQLFSLDGKTRTLDEYQQALDRRG
jgi:hypothetical protein